MEKDLQTNAFAKVILQSQSLTHLCLRGTALK